MLDLKICRDLLKEEKYNEIYIMFEEEFIKVFKELLGYDAEQEKTLVKLILDMQRKYPEYDGTFKVLTEAFFNEKLLKAEKISFFLDVYPEVLKLYKN